MPQAHSSHLPYVISYGITALMQQVDYKVHKVDSLENAEKTFDMGHVTW